MAKKSSLFDVVKGFTPKRGTKKDKEIEKYERILEQQPDDRNALNTLGDLYAKRGDTDKACERYLRVGELYAKDGFTLKAIAVYKKAQRAKPNLVSTYLNLAGLYVQKGLIGEAKSNYLTVAEMQAAAGAKHDSLDTYRKIADLDPNNVKIRSKLAVMYESEDFIEDAAAIYADIGDVIIHEDVENGKKYYQRALELQPRNEDILARIGYSFSDLRMQAEAVNIFEKLREMFPKNLDYQDQLQQLSEPMTPQKISAVPTSIEVSGEELTSLNFGDESEEPLQNDIHVLDFSIADAGSSEISQPEPIDQNSEEHSLDFTIEDQGSIAWESDVSEQPSSTSSSSASDHSGDSPVSEPEVPSSTSSEFFDLAARLDTSIHQGQDFGWNQQPSTPASKLKIEAPEKLATDEISEIVKEFKQGVLEEVGVEDYETHYELGISYKEMSLLDDAIEELKLASLEPSKFVECQSVIALCHIEKEEYDQAIQAFQKARERVEEGGEKYQDITYQIATIYEQQKKKSEAAQEFQEIFQINSDYRDVKQKLKKLQK